MTVEDQILKMVANEKLFPTEVPPGFRNTCLCAAIQFFYTLDPENYVDLVYKYNDRFNKPPLLKSEVWIAIREICFRNTEV